MKKLSAILALVIVLTMTMSIISVSAATSLAFTLTEVETDFPGYIMLNIGYTPMQQKVSTFNIKITYDPTLISPNAVDDIFPAGSAAIGPGVDENNVALPWTDGVIWVSGGSAGGFRGNSIEKIYFLPKEGANGMATFKIEEVKKLSDTSTPPQQYDYDLSSASVTVKVGTGVSEDPKPEVFTVDKTVDGGVVKVEVKNAEKAEAGKIYVATFNGGVLVDCIEKTIANGTLDFAGLEGDVNTAQMFVWNEQLVPITYATSAQ